MIIKDTEGKYTFKVDKSRRIVHEEIKGNWTAEDYRKYCDEYMNKIMPYLGKGAWAKFVDLRESIPNTKLTPEIVNAHVKWAADNGLTRTAIVVVSATYKMQMNRAGRDVFMPMHFDDVQEADRWLKSEGF